MDPPVILLPVRQLRIGSAHLSVERNALWILLLCSVFYDHNQHGTVFLMFADVWYVICLHDHVWLDREVSAILSDIEQTTEILTDQLLHMFVIM